MMIKIRWISFEIVCIIPRMKQTWMIPNRKERGDGHDL
jgi:hypothetical protein